MLAQFNQLTLPMRDQADDHDRCLTIHVAGTALPSLTIGMAMLVERVAKELILQPSDENAVRFHRLLLVLNATLPLEVRGKWVETAREITVSVSQGEAEAWLRTCLRSLAGLTENSQINVELDQPHAPYIYERRDLVFRLEIDNQTIEERGKSGTGSLIDESDAAR